MMLTLAELIRWSSSAESERVRVLLHLRGLKTRTLQSRAERVGRYGNQRVADMHDPHLPALQTVAADQKTARLQHAEHFSEDLVLQFSGRNVMQQGMRLLAEEGLGGHTTIVFSVEAKT
jgi:hypothetical protein